MTTCGSMISPSLGRKQKFSHVWCNWACLSPTRLNRRFSNSGTIVEKYNEVTDLAIEATLHLVLRGDAHTENLFFKIDAFCIVHITERDWDVNREMRGCGLVEWPVFLLHDGDSEDDFSDE